LIGLAVLFTVFFAFYIEGYKLTGADLRDPNQLANDVTGALTSLPMIFGAVIAILLVAHEYRYNTIMYALTSSNSRSKVLLAKFIVISGFALVFTLFIAVLSPTMSYLGVHAHGHSLAPQTIDYGSLLWRALFNGWAYLSAALLLAVLIRNQIGAIVSLFIIPTFEQVLSLLLKGNSVYLPFISLNSVLVHPDPKQGMITYAHAALVFALYLAVGWIIAWVLFLRRDAN
jgi:ABC-type transport system involved in multi-copper enzyme maturation permease subunit